MEIMLLDPEWTHWVKCPMPECKIVTHGCCEEHVRDGMVEHLSDAHNATTYVTKGN